jgi:hypothetical protein
MRRIILIVAIASLLGPVVAGCEREYYRDTDYFYSYGDDGYYYGNERGERHDRDDGRGQEGFGNHGGGMHEGGGGHGGGHGR